MQAVGMETVTLPGRGITMCMVAEWIDGVTLADYLQTEPSVRQLRRVAMELAEAVAYVHQQQVVHRDLKPANLMIDKDGRIRLLDFGVAHAEKESEDDLTLTVAGSQIGTGAYMSPEQTLNEDATPLSDLFSMGIIGAEMLLGENVFRGENLSKTFKRIQKLRIKAEAFPKGTPKALIKVILKLLAKNPSKRYLSAADAADDLSKIMKGYPRHMEPYLAEWVLATINGKESLVEPQIVQDKSKKFFMAGTILGAVVVAALWILTHFL